jgi:hypothetical protein
MTDDAWLTDRLAYLRGLRSPTEHQRLLLQLADQPTRTEPETRTLAALIRVEKAADRAQKARAAAARLLTAEKIAARKARNHELYLSAGLLILAGLVETKTGQPTRDRGELLGALVALANTPATATQRATWKRTGDTLLKAPRRSEPKEVS